MTTQNKKIEAEPGSTWSLGLHVEAVTAGHDPDGKQDLQRQVAQGRRSLARSSGLPHRRNEVLVMAQRKYRLYVEMTDRCDLRTNVWQRVSSDAPLTHREALTMRSKMMRPAAVLLVEADSQAERDMEPLYKDWSDSLDELVAIRRDKTPPSNETPHAR